MAPSGAPCRGTAPRRRCGTERAATRGLAWLKTPLDAAAAARLGRPVGLNRRAELEGGRAPPDLLEGLPEEIAQDNPLVVAGDPSGGAAGQPVAGHRSERPRAPAPRSPRYCP